MKWEATPLCAFQGPMVLSFLVFAALVGTSACSGSLVIRETPKGPLLAGRKTGAEMPRVDAPHRAAGSHDAARAPTATDLSGNAGASLVETGATTALTREHLRALTDLVEEKLRVAPTDTLAGISSMLKSVNYAGGGQVCLDFAATGATPTSPTAAPKLYNTLPGTYEAANFTCPPSAKNLGDLTCTGWGGNMPWKHYIQFTQAQKPQLSIYDCAKMCEMSPGCRYYWWQVVVKPKAQAVCSLIHDTKEHGMAGCTGNPMMSFPYAGQQSAAVYCPLVLGTRKEIGSGPLTCAGASPSIHKDCVYQVRSWNPTAGASPAAAAPAR